MRAQPVIRTIVATLAVLVVGALIFMWSGIYNVAAIDPHWHITHWFLETARTQSIKMHAADIVAPTGLGDRTKIVIGTEHFAAHCSVCHGAPGVPSGDIAHGLYPKPPDLRQAAQRYTPSELFWIVKNGIKSTGMPAWNAHDDDSLWATVAFLEALPTMSQQDYAGLVMQTLMMGDSHDHGK